MTVCIMYSLYPTQKGAYALISAKSKMKLGLHFSVALYAITGSEYT